ncbi:MAG TPA: hypothetical protein VGH23_10905 [Rhizomicrobium sp.]|jgi:hypothetical protein
MYFGLCQMPTQYRDLDAYPQECAVRGAGLWASLAAWLGSLMHTDAAMAAPRLAPIRASRGASENRISPICM